MSLIGSPRRYYLSKRHAAIDNGDRALALVWRSKQEAEPGTALPSDFPHLTALQGCGYKTTEDLNGADVQELTELGFETREATAILTALSEI